MPLIVPPGFAQAAFVFQSEAGTAPIVTTLGVDVGAAGGDFVTVANDLMEAYALAFATLTSNVLTLERVSLYIGQEGPSGSIDSDLAPIAMANTGVFGPIAMAIIARKVTNNPGRRGRGRMFIPGSASEANTEEDGSVNSAARGAFNASLDQFYETITEAVSPQTYATPPVLLHSSAPADPTPIVGFTTADLVGWIRGRIR